MRYLVTGPSGSGKTSIAQALRDRGYIAYDTDSAVEGLAGFYDDTNRLTNDYDATAGKEWLIAHPWMWDETVLRAFLDAHAKETIFLCGGADNVHELLGLFDKVFLLETAPDTIARRLTDRSRWHIFSFGQQDHERQYVQEVMIPYYEHRVAPHHITHIDSNRPLALVVADIVRHVRGAAA